MKRTVKSSISIFLLLSILSCYSQNEKHAISVMDKYIENRKSNNIMKCMDFYSEGFYNFTSKDYWFNTIKDMQDKYGKIIEFKLSAMDSKKIDNINAKGEEIKLSYFVTYMSTITVEEFYLFKDSNTNEIKIYKHNIKSQSQ